MEFNKAYLQKLNSPEEFNDVELELLKDYGIIAKKDEQTNILCSSYEESKNDKKSMYLTITLTNQCNFDCVYCYQSREVKMINMKKADSIIKYIEHKATKGIDRLFIHWFGGEPLLNLAVAKYIDSKLTEIADKYCLDYNSTMTTNGYLINELYSDLKSMNISMYTITLDGVDRFHNLSRPHVSGESTFDKVLKNIKMLIDDGKNVCIRYNVNELNKKVSEFFDVLKLNEIIDKVSLSFVKTSKLEKSNQKEGFYIENEEDYAGILLNIYKEMLNYSISIPKYISFGTQCRYDNINSYLINTDLELFYCSEEAGVLGGKIGNIKHGKEFLLEERVKEKNNFNPFEIRMCRECNVFPLCKGGCRFLLALGKCPCITEKKFIKNK